MARVKIYSITSGVVGSKEIEVSEKNAQKNANNVSSMQIP